MWKKVLVFTVFAVLVSLLAPSKSHTSNSQPTTAEPFGHIVLDHTGKVTVRTRMGDAYCRKGALIQIDPEGRTLYQYGEGSTVAEIGPYFEGTSLAFAIQPGTSLCQGKTWYSTDRLHAQIHHNGGCSWTIIWEDLKDEDFNDLYTDITCNYNDTVGMIISGQAFGIDPIYKLPYPAGQTHKVTVDPGEGEHLRNNRYGVAVCCMAYDFDMRRGNLITASAAGMVLWVEDNFEAAPFDLCGEGVSDETRDAWRPKTNVIVIQTEADVHTAYVHLLKDSTLVHVGDFVRQGQIIAAAGNTGFVCGKYGGYHLHFEWQHHCYDLPDARQRRNLRGNYVGQPTLAWSCTGYSPDAPFYFEVNGTEQKLYHASYTSDNDWR